MDIDKIMAVASRASSTLDHIDAGLDIVASVEDAVTSLESMDKYLSQSEAISKQKAADAAVDRLQNIRRAEYRAGDVVKEALKMQALKREELKSAGRVTRAVMPSIPMIKGGKVVGPIVDGSRAFRLPPAAYSSISDRVSGKRRLINAIDAAGLGMIDSSTGTSKQFQKAARSIDAVDALKGTPLNIYGRGKNLGKAILAHDLLGSPLYRAMSNRANAKRFEAIVKSGAKGMKNPEVEKAVRALDKSISPIRVIGPSHSVSMTPRSPNTVYSPRTPLSKIPGKSAGSSVKAVAGKAFKAGLKSAPIIGAIDDLGRVKQDIEEGDWRGAIAHTGDALLDTVGLGAIVNLGFNLGGENTGLFDYLIGESVESGSGLGEAMDTLKGLFT